MSNWTIPAICSLVYVFANCRFRPISSLNSASLKGIYSTKEPSVLPSEEGTKRYCFPLIKSEPFTETFPEPLPGNPVSPLGMVSFREYFGLPSGVCPTGIKTADASEPGSPVITSPSSRTGFLPASPCGRTKSILYFGLPDGSSPLRIIDTDGSCPFDALPVSITGVFPSLPLFPLLPRGIVRNSLYFGRPSSVVPFSLKVADASVSGSPVEMLPNSKKGIAPSSPLGSTRPIL